MSVTPVRIGLLGLGTVGAALVELLREQSEAITSRTGLSFEIAAVAVRDASKPRQVQLDPSIVTTDAEALVQSPDVDVVVEVMGGVEPARSLLLDAIKAGKPVVTANKELIAKDGFELYAAAEAAGVDVLFEAAVAGGIPIVRPLRESLLGEPVDRVLGIVNGTTNYILTQMTESGADYADALAEAQALGYAEADPTADVEGYDAGAKIAIVAAIAFGARVSADDVFHAGISDVTAADIAFASRKGYVVKLLAIAERVGGTGDEPVEIGLRVHPALVPVTHPLAAVRDSFNAVFVQGGAVGDLMFYGRGAGGGPTASAVLGDLIDASLNLRKGTHASIGQLRPVQVRPIDELRSAYFIDVEVVDEPGVLATIAATFGSNDVSISSMEQEIDSESAGARLLFITHTAREADVQTTVRELRGLDVVRKVGSVLRVLSGAES